MPELSRTCVNDPSSCNFTAHSPFELVRFGAGAAKFAVSIAAGRDHRVDRELRCRGQGDGYGPASQFCRLKRLVLVKDFRAGSFSWLLIARADSRELPRAPADSHAPHSIENV